MTKMHATTIKAMLDEPRLPKEPTAEMLHAIANSQSENDPWNQARTDYAALYAHLTKPKTKEIDVWRVDFAVDGEPDCVGCLSEEAAKEFARTAEVASYTCIKIIGPYKQEVPT